MRKSPFTADEEQGINLADTSSVSICVGEFTACIIKDNSDGTKLITINDFNLMYDPLSLNEAEREEYLDDLFKKQEAYQDVLRQILDYSFREVDNELSQERQLKGARELGSSTRKKVIARVTRVIMAPRAWIRGTTLKRVMEGTIVNENDNLCRYDLLHREIQYAPEFLETALQRLKPSAPQSLRNKIQDGLKIAKNIAYIHSRLALNCEKKLDQAKRFYEFLYQPSAEETAING
jgi:hypothetical protein